MRKKEMKLVITFHTTADAMAMEKRCKTEKMEGRLIPVPRILSAGCGMAWACPPLDSEQLTRWMQERHLRYESIQECLV
ncbi:DUF3343 domain-containing protein [Diplocloster agilis]|uniref:DUF3343 domain-containing protein n=1 Tax=Diplocloster agilis TaxID=2850323 RepID=A0A949NGI4_9FIRM|nr:DUF3343 domain-containing protein [Diplocloster agilis]MBU9738919.1 DUF3343 domain-containing protein [Diplocloster agilis]MBU9746823.1 DUF3343 domain-containing protein [Diplocloster agilis]